MVIQRLTDLKAKTAAPENSRHYPVATGLDALDPFYDYVSSCVVADPKVREMAIEVLRTHGGDERSLSNAARRGTCFGAFQRKPR